MDILELRTVARLLDARNRAYPAEREWSAERPAPEPERPATDSGTLAARRQRDALDAWLRAERRRQEGGAR